MIKMILLFICVVLAIFGLAELIHGIRLIFISPKKRAKTFSVILLEGGYAEQQMMYAAEQSAWLGLKYADSILAVDTGISVSERKVCENMALDGNAVVCSAEEAILLIKDSIKK